MRFVKSIFAALAVLVVAGGQASAIDVNKKQSRRLGKCWWSGRSISEFCSIKDWHPAIADCTESKEGSATYRVLTLKDNGGTIKEKLDGSDDTSYTYEILESPLPVENYSAKFWVEPDERDPNRTVIHWDATFDAKGKSDDEAKKIVGDVFLAGLKSIKQKAMPPEDAPAQ